MEGNAFVYILASRPNGTLYVGVTTDLARRVWQHKEGRIEGFSKRYGVKRLVYYAVFADLQAAQSRERTLKRWRRTWKLELVENANPDWRDLYEEITR